MHSRPAGTCLLVGVAAPYAVPSFMGSSRACLTTTQLGAYTPIALADVTAGGQHRSEAEQGLE